ncbi:MAG: hypothetical protein KBE27_03610 [Syntrophorhabdaceae bacterium]|nr:hypothetical protein [Syntrophorhabdales bacterium]MBP9560888.1 hypothetical protein [Syntrophorhabdaceae bacterium]
MDRAETYEIHGTQKNETLEWDCAVPIFTNRFFYQDCIMISALTLLVCASSFGVLNLLYYIRYRQFIGIPVYSEYTLPAFLFFFAIIAIAACIMFILSKNRYPCHFVLNHEGVSIAYMPEKGICRIFGFFAPLTLSKKTQKTGKNSGHIYYAWERIEQAVPYPKTRAIALYGAFMRIGVIYCPEDLDLYSEVLHVVQNALWRAEKTRRLWAERTKKQFLNRLLWIVFLFIMTLLASEAPLVETSIPVWILFILSVIATVTGSRVRQAIGLINLLIVTVLAILMIYRGLKMEYSGLGMFAYNFFRNLVHPDYLIFFILSLTGFFGFVVYSWVIILTRTEGSQGDKIRPVRSEGIIRTGLVLMFIIIVSIVYTVYWQIFQYEKAVGSLPETIKYLPLDTGDSKETKTFKVSYNAMLDALNRYHNAEDSEKDRAHREYKRLRKIVFEKQQRMIEAMVAKQKKTAAP